MASFSVSLVTADSEVVADVEATAVYARSLEGEIGILPGHQPVLLALDIAPLKIKEADGGEIRAACHNGFLFYSENQLVILADMAEVVGDIDVEYSRKRMQEIEEALKTAKNDREEELRDAYARHETRVTLADGRAP